MPVAIGKEIARTFLREGAKLAIADLNQAGAEAAAMELGGAERRAIGIAMDVTSEEQVEAGMAKAVKTLGRVLALVMIALLPMLLLMKRSVAEKGARIGGE